jgi:Ger(x)C family germination protein
MLLTGCWDKIEIDQKIFVSTIGIDAGKDIDKEKEQLKNIKPDEPFQERIETKKLGITYGFPDISEMGPGKSGTAKDKFVQIDASSIEDADVKASAKSSRSIHFGHTKLLIISSAILERPDTFKEIVDYLSRNPNLNKMMNVVVAEGKADDFIKYVPNTEKNIETFISGLMESSKKNATILPVTVNEMLILLDENGNALVPKLSMEKDKGKNEVVLSGLAVIKDYALKGFLTPVEVSDVQLLRGKLKGGKKVIYLNKHPLDYSIDSVEREIKLSGDKNKLQFNINIELEGQIKGHYIDEQISSKDKLSEIEKDLGISITQECNIIAKMLQREFAVDPIGLREYVEKYRPSIWNQVKNNWEEVYKNSNIVTNVEVKARRIGISK